MATSTAIILKISATDYSQPVAESSYNVNTTDAPGGLYAFNGSNSFGASYATKFVVTIDTNTA